MNRKVNSTGKSAHYFKRFSLFFMLVTFCFANDHYIDSLYNAIQTHQGLPKIEAREKLAFKLRKSDYSESIKQSKIAYQEAMDIRDINLQATAKYYSGLAFYHNDMTDSALSCFNIAVKLYKEDKNFKQLGKVLCMMGTNYLGVTGDQSQAIHHYNEALVYSRKAEDHLSMAMIYSQLSNIFRMNGAYQQAIEFIYKSKEHYEEVDFREGVAWISYSIGRIYMTMSLYEEAQKELLEGLEQYGSLQENISSLKGQAICLDELGLVCLQLGDPECARQYNMRAQKIYKQIDSDFGMSNALKYLARIEHHFGNDDEAMQYLNGSLKIKKKMNDVLGYPGVYSLYGLILKDRREYNAAIDSLYVGLKYAKSNSQKNQLININKYLSEIYAEKGEFENAYLHKSNEVAIIDSIKQSKATRALTQLEDLYDLEIREARIQELEQEKMINQVNLQREIAVRNLLLIILTMTIVFAFFFMKLFSSNRQTNEILKKNQKQLQELNATKDKFTSIIAHDLKSPFNSIIGFSRLLNKYSERKDYEKITEFSKNIHETSLQTYKLLENLLEWSRSQTGKISFNPKALDIRIPVKNAMDLMYPVAQRKGIEIITDISTVAVLVDENMLHTVLQNLLSNAIKYSYHGGKIHISGKENKDKLLIKISDEGIGMDARTIDKLFQIDETVSRSGTDGEKGTGLGLILSKEFVERHRGKITVKSEKSKGSQFTVELPL